MQYNSYTPIHVHTDRDSNLHSPDCIVKIPELINKLVEFDIKACAITGHDALSGHHKFWNACQEKGIKPLLGWEGYIDLEDGNKYYHILFIAKTLKGLRNLRKLSSKAWLENYYYRPRIKLEWLEELGKDLIVTDACLGGVVKKHLLYMLNKNTNKEKIQEKLDWFIKKMKSIFKNDFYLELQAGEQPEQIFANKQLINIAEQYNITLIASSDVHYLRPEHKKIHEIFLNSRQDTEREQGEFYNYTYLMTYNEMFNILSKQIGEKKAKEILENTNEIAKKVELYSIKNKPILPKVKIPQFKFLGYLEQYFDTHKYIKKFYESPYTIDKYWLSLIEQGLLKNIQFNRKKYQNIKYINRINRELEIMWYVSENIETRVSQYYVSMVDNINIAKKCGSLSCIGRGSVVGFLTCYLTEITQLDPLDYNIPEWRHLSKERPEMPDIDVDFEPRFKHQILEELTKYHGENKIISCCTFGTITSKSAILTAARGLNIDSKIAQKISNLIPVDRGKNWTLKDCLEGDEEKGYNPIKELIDYQEKYPKLFYIAQQLEGLIDKRSQHASAIFIYDDNYTNYNAVMKTPSGEIVTQLDMDDSTEEGGTKYDFLWTEQQMLKHLTLDTIGKNYDEYLHPRVLDFNNQEVYKQVFHKGKTKTIFQWNSQLGMNALKKLLPCNLTELATGNNIIRLKGNALEKYLRYKNNPKLFDEDYPELTESERQLIKEILKDSCYVAITQEDMMRLSMKLGFSEKQANALRKAVAKKKSKLMEETRQELFETAKENNYREEFVKIVWDDFIKPLEGYAFSTNHTYPYSAEGFQDAFLLLYHPLEWYKSYLTVASGAFDLESEKNKSSDYGKLATIIADIKSEGVEIAHPDINKSGYEFDIDNNKILFGLKGITHIGDWVVEQIIQNRPYTSFQDFLNKNVINPKDNNKKFEKRIILNLIKSGCFDQLEPNKSRKNLVIEYINATYKPLKNINTKHGEELIKLGIIKKIKINSKDDLKQYIKNHKKELLDIYNRHRKNQIWLEWRQNELKGNLLDWEFSALNCYITQHPLKNYESLFTDFNKIPEESDYTLEKFTPKGQKESIQYKKYKLTRIAGTVLDKIIKDKKIELYTPTATVTVVLTAKDWDKYSDLLERGNKLVIKGFKRNNMFYCRDYYDSNLIGAKIMEFKEFLKTIKQITRRGNI